MMTPQAVKQGGFEVKQSANNSNSPANRRGPFVIKLKQQVNNQSTFSASVAPKLTIVRRKDGSHYFKRNTLQVCKPISSQSSAFSK